MGNPHPTKSKPVKIGRKHTQSNKRKKMEGAKKYAEIVKSAARKRHAKYKKQVAAYWNGEISEHPRKPS